MFVQFRQVHRHGAESFCFVGVGFAVVLGKPSTLQPTSTRFTHRQSQPYIYRKQIETWHAMMQENADDTDDSVDGFLPNVDLSDVTFDFDPEMYEKIANADYDPLENTALQDLGNRLANGEYSSILQELDCNETGSTVKESIRSWVEQRANSSLEDCLRMELLGIASLNLFLQNNYTGPAKEDDFLVGINPHPVFADKLCDKNAILAELAVDGHWPCPICQHPYFLLLARTIFSTLIGCAEWMGKNDSNPIVVGHSSAYRWSARAALAHQRLLQSSTPPITLWKEVEQTFDTIRKSTDSPTAWLEWGLAEHYFNRPGTGKASFREAVRASGLQVKVTGAVGKRTKFQSKATAQMVVVAESTTKDAEQTSDPAIKRQMIEHSEDGILLERINFEDEEKNDRTAQLSIRDQSILLALCLDVKNSNPVDGLTNEEMGAFLARVLDHHDDWMVYSTALLERSWLEFERSHARERAILQMQALADQHTNRLTITQSTRESIETSAPVQERLRNIHYIVYPPRWAMIQDLAERYAALGIVTSAAELFTEIELWDSVVECYRRAGRTAHAEKVVREHLETQETPRMWAALGDLTKDPHHYRKAIELSKGRFSDAFLALAEHHFDKGELNEAANNFEEGLKVQPLNPSAWFRLGAISMQTRSWDRALRAFSEVVMQKPEEGDAWANIAAIHLHNKKPGEAYPALIEALKHQRSNWRVWVSKLYTCMDLARYDEAIQACNTLLDLRAQNQVSQGVPMIEEKCVRGIVGGILKRMTEAGDDKASLDSAQRTLSRTHALLMRLNSAVDVEDEAWVLEVITFFNSQTSRDVGTIIESLMKEYRAMQSIQAWEKDEKLVKKICEIVSQIGRLFLSKQNHTKQELTKSRYLMRGIIQKIDLALADVTSNDAMQQEINRLEELSEEIDSAARKLST